MLVMTVYIFAVYFYTYFIMDKDLWVSPPIS